MPIFLYSKGGACSENKLKLSVHIRTVVQQTLAAVNFGDLGREDLFGAAANLKIEWEGYPRFWFCLNKMDITRLIMVQFSKFKNCQAAVSELYRGYLVLLTLI